MVPSLLCCDHSHLNRQQIGSCDRTSYLLNFCAPPPFFGGESWSLCVEMPLLLKCFLFPRRWFLVYFGSQLFAAPCTFRSCVQTLWHSASHLLHFAAFLCAVIVFQDRQEGGSTDRPSILSTLCLLLCHITTHAFFSPLTHIADLLILIRH